MLPAADVVPAFSVFPTAKFVIVRVSPSPLLLSFPSASLAWPLVIVLEPSDVETVIVSLFAVTTSSIPVIVNVIIPISKALDPAFVSSSFTLNSNGSYSYDVSGNAASIALANGATATDTFSYKVKDP